MSKTALSGGRSRWVVAAVAAAIMPAPQVSTKLGDAPEWETSQTGSKLDLASFNIATSHLITIEPNWMQFTWMSHALHGEVRNSRGKLP